MDNHAVIRFEKVSLQIEGKQILREIDFSIEEGEKIILWGKSGSGKSSLLKLIVGGLIPTRGQVFFQGEPISVINIGRVRRSVAFIGQEPVLGSEWVRDGLLLPFQYKVNSHLKPSTSQIEETLRQLDLPVEILSQKTDSISGGEKQRLAIVRSLLLQKNIFLLDEVTSALDAASKHSVLKLFCEHTSGTILAITHDPDWLARCEKYIEIEAGRIKNVHNNLTL